MADIITLLPDNIANQIAAGEVVQRPASVVKELLENSLDAGATQIQVIVNESGKKLIQVIDNGCGMSETDARLSFEKHATSKIKSINDLFAIQTMGFRGEALASIAAVAQVELKTKLCDREVGTFIRIEDSEVKKQEDCSCSNGTSIAVKNLFFNVPARRNFLKSNSVEMKHIIEEFQRVALINPSVGFELFHNEQEVFHLTAGNLRQRIVSVFGNKYNEKIVPVGEKTEVVNISGFIGKTEFAKKTRGEQYIFVNQRFIKSPYINHAITSAYAEILPQKTYPFYVLILELDASKIDVNVHPTKQEIKFEDERIIYAYVHSSIKRALGQFHVIPSLDFDQETSFSNLESIRKPVQNPQKQVSNVAISKEFRQTRINLGTNQNWETLYESLKKEPEQGTEPIETETNRLFSTPQEITPQNIPYQIHNQYIINTIKSGFILIDQRAAHARILYEKFLRTLHAHAPNTQQRLFSKTIELNAEDSLLMKELLPEVQRLGFDMEEFGKNSFVIHGLPVNVTQEQEEDIVERLIEQYKHFQDTKVDKRDNLAKAMAYSSAISRNKKLETQEMQALIDELFACEMPNHAPNGNKTIITFKLDELAKQF